MCSDCSVGGMGRGRRWGWGASPKTCHPLAGAPWRHRQKQSHWLAALPSHLIHQQQYPPPPPKHLLSWVQTPAPLSTPFVQAFPPPASLSGPHLGFDLGSRNQKQTICPLEHKYLLETSPQPVKLWGCGNKPQIVGGSSGCRECPHPTLGPGAPLPLAQ